jgi:hypothetical protein
MAKLVGWKFEKDSDGNITHLLARLPVEKDAKTAKGQRRYYSSGGFLNVENESDEKLVVSCTAFQGKK